MNGVFKSVTFCVSVGMFMVTVSLFQGCSSDFEESLETKNESAVISEYLDCPSDLSSEEELMIIDKAFQRIGDRFVIEDDTCYLTVQSAKDMNMSDAVFDLVKQSVNSLNAQYAAYVYFENNEKGIIMRNPFEMRPPIATTRATSESTSGPNMITTTTVLNNEETITVLNAMRSASDKTSFYASLLAGGLSGAVAGALVSIYCGASSSQLSAIQDEYARSGSTNGITLTETYMWSSTTGVGSTSYRSSIN